MIRNYIPNFYIFRCLFLGAHMCVWDNLWATDEACVCLFALVLDLGSDIPLPIAFLLTSASRPRPMLFGGYTKSI